METTITSKGQITIPAKLRRKLGLKPGMKLEFDESASFVKATRPVDLKRMRSAIGCLKGRLPEGSKASVGELRGPVELPRKRKKKCRSQSIRRPGARRRGPRSRRRNLPRRRERCQRLLELVTRDYELTDTARVLASHTHAG